MPTFYYIWLLGVSSTSHCVCVCARAQLCLTLCDLLECSLPGSSVHGIFQARILDWVAISCQSLGDLPDPGIEPTSLVSLTLAVRCFTTAPLGKHDLHQPSVIPPKFKSCFLPLTALESMIENKSKAKLGKDLVHI